MLCRALLTAIAISYLICVLWLSGMQKEDLEVNMLRKLQRHNVNIDNMNAEDLRNECLNSAIKKDNTVNEGNSTADLLENQTTLENLESNKKANIAESDLSIIRKELIDKNISGYATFKSHKNKMRASLKSLRDNSTNDHNEEYTDNNSLEVTTLSAKTTTEGMKYVTDQAELERVIQFWQKFITTHKPQEHFAFTNKALSDTRVIPPEVIITNSQTKLKSIIQFRPMITKTVLDRTTTLADSTTKPSDTKNKRINTSKFPNFKTMMQYWQLLTTTRFVDDTVTKPSYFVTENIQFQRHSKADEERSQSKESELINKLLAEYVYQGQKQTSRWKTTTATPVDLKKLSRQIERLLNLFPQEINITNRNIAKDDNQSETKLRKSLPPEEFDVEKGIPQKSVIFSERTRYNDNIRKQKNENELKNTNYETDELNYNRQHLIHNNNKQNYDQSVGKQLGTISPIAKTKQHFTNEKENMRTLSQDVIKEIAENVKSIVLNDIRKEIPSTGMPSTIKNNERTTISAIPRTIAATKQAATGQNTKQVMEKFIEFFEHFKTVTEAAVVTSNPKIVTSDKKYFQSQYQNPLNMKTGAPMLVFDNKDRPSENTPELFSTFGIQIVPSINTKIQNLPIREATVNSDQIIQKKTPQIKGEIVMMQTNSGEIPPLGIPLSNPPRLIHQNIIVTTKHPIDSYSKLRESWIRMQQSGNFGNKINIIKDKSWKYNSNPSRPQGNLQSSRIIQLNSNSVKEKSREQREQWNQEGKPENYFKDTTRLSKERLFKHIALSGSSENAKNGRLYESNIKPRNSRFRNQHDIKRPLYSSRYEDILNSKLNGEYHESKENKREKKYFDKISFGTFSRHRNGERFHEKLERIDDLRGESQERKEDECCRKLKVASRKQRPLTNDKRASSYDDSHFRNFLRTQQKVNSMLERILATKTVQDGPRSVETT